MTLLLPLSDLEPTKLNLSDYDLIIGTTKEIAISSFIHPLLKKGVILASISSSDREFDAVHLRKFLKPTNNCHDNVIVNNIYLLNSGFPINFYATDIIYLWIIYSLLLRYYWLVYVKLSITKIQVL